MTPRRLAGLACAVAGLAVLHLHMDGLLADGGLPLTEQLRLVLGWRAPETFAELNFCHAQLPRACMALLVGGALGLAGSLMQQLTRNMLASPLTLGTSSGAWLALVALNIWLPQHVAACGAPAALLGGLLAFGLIVFITGVRNMDGLPLVVSGMVVNILLGAITTALVLLHEEFARSVFLWGAGDLAQNGWQAVLWLLPRLAVAPVLLLAAPRLLTLLRLGHEGAAARGLPVIPAFLLLMAASIWLASASIATVGVIGFIGLLAPNMARSLGARTPGAELWTSLLLGAALLSGTDALAMLAGTWTQDVVPCGVAAAAMGSPALLWLSRRRLRAQDTVGFSFRGGARVRPAVHPAVVALLAGAAVLGILAHILIQPDGGAWHWAAPSAYQWSVRWPRLTTALCAGAALAVAGTILQRLVGNPLASPDILGVSSGATFALVLAGLLFGQAVSAAQWPVALLGSAAVLAALLRLGNAHGYAPSSLIIAGVALTALLDALVQFCLARGTGDSYAVLLWLSGSTYRTSPTQALLLAAGTAALSVAGLGLSRWLTLLSAGRDVARARGLDTRRASLVLLAVVALLCALVTSSMGPVTFVGLVAPHAASLLGARTARAQLATGALVGAALMLWADWIGQTALYPTQIAAGIVVSIVGGCYFLALMIGGRLRSPHGQP